MKFEPIEPVKEMQFSAIVDGLNRVIEVVNDMALQLEDKKTFKSGAKLAELSEYFVSLKVKREQEAKEKAEAQIKADAERKARGY